MYSEKWFYVYIMTNRSKNFYIGVSNNIRERVFQHKTGAFEGFTGRYKLDRLVYWEKFKYVKAAIAREKQLKRWTRVKKNAVNCHDESHLEGLGCRLVSRSAGKTKCIDPSTSRSHTFALRSE
jgi:putative endonuclease